jgi:predicted RNase H-like HicB family nuclease
MLKTTALEYNIGIRSASMIPTYTAVVHKIPAGGYFVTCDDFENCFAEGGTIREAQLNMYKIVAKVVDDEYLLSFEMASPAKLESGKTLGDLFAEFDGKYESLEFDWGQPAGNEIW